MNTIITKQFEKDVQKELTKPLQLKLATLIETLQQAPSLDAIADVKKLRGYKTAYRIRMGDYRIIYAIADEIKIIDVRKVSHRKDVYD